MVLPLTGILAFDDSCDYDIDAVSDDEWQEDDYDFDNEIDGFEGVDDIVSDSSLSCCVDNDMDGDDVVEGVVTSDFFDELSEEGLAIALMASEDLAADRQQLSGFQTQQSKKNIELLSPAEYNGFDKINLRPFEAFVKNYLGKK